MSAQDSTILQMQEQQSRVLYVLVAALFPILLAGLITFAVFASGVVRSDDGIGYKTSFAEFSFPTPGDLVDSRFKAFGLIHNVPQGKELYLVERSESRYWPKKKLSAESSQFSREQYASDGKGYKYTIELLALDSSAVARFDKWFEIGKETGKYPGLSDMNGVQPLARVRVVRK